MKLPDCALGRDSSQMTSYSGTGSYIHPVQVPCENKLGGVRAEEQPQCLSLPRSQHSVSESGVAVC